MIFFHQTYILLIRFNKQTTLTTNKPFHDGIAIQKWKGFKGF